MLRAPFSIVTALLAASLLATGCSSTPEDKTAGWTTDRIYAEARDELNSGGY
ncbi:MAG TPA: outer membrane protein assembly factor BamD, partial [Giesbergeria sp.]|nr:outer membrane protein assembly factor BamD [Giesbergeria sp.]